LLLDGVIIGIPILIVNRYSYNCFILLVTFYNSSIKGRGRGC